LNFADKLRKFRGDRTQKEMWEILRSTKDQYKNWELGRSIPKAKSLELLIELSGKGFDYWLKNDNQDEPEHQSTHSSETTIVTIAAHKEDPLGDLSPEEHDELLHYLEWIRNRKEKGK